MSKYQFVVDGVYGEKQEEKPLFILTEYDELEGNEKLLFRVLKNEKILKLEKVSSFLHWLFLGGVIMAIGTFVADFSGIFEPSPKIYLAILVLFSFSFFTNLFLSSIRSSNSSFFLTDYFNREDFFTAKEYAPEFFDKWIMTVKCIEDSKGIKELPAENCVSNVLVLAYLRKNNRGRKIPFKWAALIDGKDENHLEFAVDKSLNF